MILPKIPIGSSADWTAPLKNKDGSAADLSTLLGYAIFIYDPDGNEVAKYSKNSVAGFINTLGVDSLVPGGIRMKWEASQTKNFPAVQLNYQVMVQLTNTDFEANRFTAKTDIIPLCIMTATGSKQYPTI